MSNMSYCRFQNTRGDLQDCLDTMQGMDGYYQCKKDLSSEEYSAMLALVQTCREIVETHDAVYYEWETMGSENVLMRDEPANEDDTYE